MNARCTDAWRRLCVSSNPKRRSRYLLKFLTLGSLEQRAKPEMKVRLDGWAGSLHHLSRLPQCNVRPPMTGVNSSSLRVRRCYSTG